MAEGDSSQQNTYRGVIINFNTHTDYESFREQRSCDLYNIHMIFRPNNPELQGFLVPIVHSTLNSAEHTVLHLALRRLYQAFEWEPQKGKDIPVEVVLDKPISQEQSSYKIQGLIKLLT